MSDITRPKDVNGNDITLKARVVKVDEPGNIGRVEHFGIDDNNKITVHVIWIVVADSSKAKRVVYPKDIIVSEVKQENALSEPTTKPAPTKTPTKTPDKKPNPLKIPTKWPETMPKPLPKAVIGGGLKLSEYLSESEKIAKISSERIRMKNMLKEAPMDIDDTHGEQPDPSIKKGIENQTDTPFKDVEYFQNKQGDKSTLEKLGSEEFKDVADTMQGKQKIAPTQYMQVIKQIMHLESSNRTALEELAKRLVKTRFGLSDDIMEMIEAKLTSQPPSAPDSPSDELASEVLDELNSEQKEIVKKHVDKRIIHNALMMGAGYRGHDLFNSVRRELDGMNPQLYNLYDSLFKNFELLAWQIPMSTPRVMAGKSEIKIDPETNQIKAQAQAIMFPVLLHEVAKAAMEILFAQHLVDIFEQHGEKVHKAVVSQSDSYKSEHWMKLIGPRLWKYLHDALEYVIHEEGGNREIVPYILNKLGTMQPDEFITFMNNVVHDGPVAITKIKEMVATIKTEIEEYEAQNNEVPTPEQIETKENNQGEIAHAVQQNQHDILAGTENKEKMEPKNYKQMDIDVLNNELQNALETEDYVAAAKIRDEINSR